MCLIAFALDCHPRYRLALIANRDELHARPAAPAGADPDFPDVYGGRDLQLGGGWLMVSRRGRLAAVTNVRVGLGGLPMPRSRGELVRDFNRKKITTTDWLRDLEPDVAEYAPFNLVLWDGSSAWFASNHPRFEARTITRGVHAMSNGAFDAPWPKSTHATQALAHWLRSETAGDAAMADVSPLFVALADDTPAPDESLPDTGIGLELERRLSPPFVRDALYGTRCSTVVLVDDDGIRFVERRFDAGGTATGDSDTWLQRTTA